VESDSNVSAIQEHERILPGGYPALVVEEEAFAEECEEEDECEEEEACEAEPLVKEGLGVIVADGKIVLLETELETESNGLLSRQQETIPVELCAKTTATSATKRKIVFQYIVIN